MTLDGRPVVQPILILHGFDIAPAGAGCHEKTARVFAQPNAAVPVFILFPDDFHEDALAAFAGLTTCQFFGKLLA